MKRGLKSIVIFSLLCLLSYGIRAQQEATFSQFMFTHQLLNPAYVGAKDYTNLTALHRAQWVGFEGAPTVQALALNGPLKNKNLAWGLSVLNDKIGPIDNTTISVDGAYHLVLNAKGHRLAAGLKIGTQNYAINQGMIQTLNPGDQAFVFEENADLLLNIGFGFYYYTPTFYLGFSLPSLLDNDRYEVSRHAYLISGGIFSLNKDWSIKPSVLFKQAEGAPVGYDFSTLLVYSKQFWIGPQIRSTIDSLLPNSNLGGAYGLLGGVHLSPNWSVGYAYSTGLGDLNANFNSGTHEIMIRFDFARKTESTLRSPRIF